MLECRLLFQVGNEVKGRKKACAHLSSIDR